MQHLTQRLNGHEQSLCKRLRHYSAYTIVPAHCTEDISSLPLNVPVYSRIICPRTKLRRTFEYTRRPGILNESQWIEGCCTQRNGAASYVDLRRKLFINLTHSPPLARLRSTVLHHESIYFFKSSEGDALFNCFSKIKEANPII
jgi:hypothetical protein